MLKMSDGGSFYEVTAKPTIDITWVSVIDDQKSGTFSGEINGWDLTRGSYGTVSVFGEFCF